MDVYVFVLCVLHLGDNFIQLACDLVSVAHNEGCLLAGGVEVVTYRFDGEIPAIQSTTRVD